MNSRALKLELINWLNNLKNLKLLHSLSSIKDSEQSGDWYESLTPKQKKSLEKGIDDHKKGRTLTGKDFRKRYEK